MKLLLDTHAFLWFVFGDAKLSASARLAIEDPGNDVALSLASIWEMTIKHGLGKLPLNAPLPAFIDREVSANAIEVVPVTRQHIYRLLTLPDAHRDPFDRLIAAQCLEESRTLVSVDKAFDLLGVPRI